MFCVFMCSYNLLLHNEMKYSFIIFLFCEGNMYFQYDILPSLCGMRCYVMYLGALGQNDLNCQLCHLKGYFIVLHEQITENWSKHWSQGKSHKMHSRKLWDISSFSKHVQNPTLLYVTETFITHCSCWKN